MRVFYITRKRIGIFLCILLMVCIMAVFFIYRAGSAPFPDLTREGDLDPLIKEISVGLTQYELQVSLDSSSKELSCRQQVDYINNEEIELDKLYFHLYPNAFKNEKFSVFTEDQMDQAYPKGFSQGWIQFESLTVEGIPIPIDTKGRSDDILVVSFNKALEPGARVRLEMKYKVKIPHSLGRFGYGEYSINLANWYPIACVYDDKGWNVEPYHVIGDPFYSDIANFKVSIEAPESYIIATTGDILDISKKGGKQIWDIEAYGVRDFAWIASDRFQVSSKVVDGTTIYSYYFNERPGRRALDYAADSVEIFNGLFGRYPYRQLSVVQTDFFIGGMEYPNLVMIDKSLYNGFSSMWLEIVTVHEVAHQWWYGLVGNDQISEPWLDEGLTEYSTILYYRHKYSPQKEASMYKQLILAKYDSIADKGIDETIGRPVYDFSNWLIYDILVYGKGAMMFHEIRETVGEAKFYSILKEYFKSNCFKNATRKDIIDACEKVTKRKWNDFFDSWLYDRLTENNISHIFKGYRSWGGHQAEPVFL